MDLLKKDFECSICQDILGTCGPPATTSCGHNYCKECITEYNQINTECPTCKEHITAIVENYLLKSMILRFYTPEEIAEMERVRNEQLRAEQERIRIQEEKQRKEEEQRERERKRRAAMNIKERIKEIMKKYNNIQLGLDDLVKVKPTKRKLPAMHTLLMNKLEPEE